MTFTNYEAMAAWLATPEARGKAWHCTVLHDDDCSPSRCRCQPEFVVEPLTAEAYMEGAKAEREWARATRKP